mmetsp:Transcript_24249/g.30515  ORF Transcript_24249/g.30515 Transcript_24249/m.30515 type:complete len:92 (-) Transcript_24249:904-1179(-)
METKQEREIDSMMLHETIKKSGIYHGRRKEKQFGPDREKKRKGFESNDLSRSTKVCNIKMIKNVPIPYFPPVFDSFQPSLSNNSRAEVSKK